MRDPRRYLAVLAVFAAAYKLGIGSGPQQNSADVADIASGEGMRKLEGDEPLSLENGALDVARRALRGSYQLVQSLRDHVHGDSSENPSAGVLSRLQAINTGNVRRRSPIGVKCVWVFWFSNRRPKSLGGASHGCLFVVSVPCWRRLSQLHTGHPSD